MPNWNQSLAFVHAALKSPKCVAHLESALGYDRVPSLKDFEAGDPDRLDLVDGFLAYLADVTASCAMTLGKRPRQGRLPLGSEGPAMIDEPPKRKRGRPRKNRSVLPEAYQAR